jgi:signal transduction histidine kinase
MGKLFKIMLTMLVLGFTSFAMASDAKDKNEAVAMVEKAVALLTKDGDSALKVIGAKNGEFHNGKLYAFVYDENVVMLAHPVKPHLAGRSYKGKPDVKGNKFRDKLVSTALNGGGWTEYVYQKPGEKGIHNKTAYSKLATNGGKKYIVVVGVYLD